MENAVLSFTGRSNIIKFSTRLFLFCIHGMFTFLWSAQGSEWELKSANTQIHLLELYSTQSCSSCPPAQAWVSNLKSHGKLWEDFIPIVFHVDYWDYLGWKDLYSKNQFTQRQRAYVRNWKSKTVYTPMFVLDGKEWRSRSIADLAKTGKNVGVLNVKRSKKDTYTVEFSPYDGGLLDYSFYGVLLGMDIKTNILDGENSGLKLQQDFLVLNLKKTSASCIKNKCSGTIILKKPNLKGIQDLKLAFWVARTPQLTPLQVVGGKIEN